MSEYDITVDKLKWSKIEKTEKEKIKKLFDKNNIKWVRVLFQKRDVKISSFSWSKIEKTEREKIEKLFNKNKIDWEIVETGKKPFDTMGDLVNIGINDLNKIRKEYYQYVENKDKQR